MTWRRRTGIITAPQGRLAQVNSYLDEHGVIAVVERFDVTAESVQVTLATDADNHLAQVVEGGVAPGTGLEEFAQDLADHIDGEVVFTEGTWVGEDAPQRSADPFEQPLGADIAAYADRAAVFNRAPNHGLEAMASQVEDVVYALPHEGGHVVFITEGPVLATVYWDDHTRPVLILEHGTSAPTLTIIPTHSDDDPIIHTWNTPNVTCPASSNPSVEGFVETVLGLGALMREVMGIFPAAEPARIRASLEEGPTQLIQSLGLPEQVWHYLESHVDAAEIDGADPIHPASFARSVRKAVSEASTSVSERAEAMRQRAVQVRTRAETAFDAAEAFAEEVILPVRQNWVSPTLAVAEPALGLLALRKARQVRGLPSGALATLAVVLLGDAAVNTVISLAPLLRRKN